MSDFTENLQEKLEKSKSKIIRTQEKENEELLRLFKSSRESLKKAFTEDTKKLKRDMHQLEQELESELEGYKIRNSKKLKGEISRGNGRYTLIILMLLVIMVFLAYPIYKEQFNNLLWIVPKELRKTLEDGRQLIVIPSEDIHRTEDDKLYYIQINNKKED